MGNWKPTWRLVIMTECYHCGVVYEVDLDDNFADAEVNYCPCCGQEQERELDFEDE